MEKRKIKILAIESSCDETAAAVIEERDGAPFVLSNIISSQVDLHAKTGGVVPEVASRAHMETIMTVVAEALVNSNLEYRNTKQIKNSNFENSENVSDFGFRISDFYQEAIEELGNITHIAVTAGPGLIGSLLVGFSAAKAISYARNLPIIPVNHIEGHIYSASAESNPKSEIRNPKVSSFDIRVSNFPLIALTVSGGHTSLTLMRDHGAYETLGATLDDAVGEAYDKVAKLLGLGYPGGPVISKMAEHFRKIDHLSLPITHLNEKLSNGQINEKWEMGNGKSQSPIVFPRPIINDGTFNFSFSGLKTSVLQKTKDIIKNLDLNLAAEIPYELKEEIAWAFEEAVADVLSFKTAKAVEKYQPKTVIFGGGVSANKYLADKIQSKVESLKSKVDFLTPPRDMTGDNAAMIGLAAYYHLKKGNISSWDEIKVDSNWELV